MEFIPTNPVIKFKPDQLQSVREQYNLDKPGDMNRAIDVLETWIKTQRHFKKKELPRNYLEKAILAGKGSLERAKSRLDKICTFRTVMPDLFGENLTRNNFNQFDVIQSLLLPEQTNDRYRVFIMKCIGSKFSHELIMNCYRYVVMLCEYFMAYDYTNGLVIVLDYTEANLFELLKHLTVTEMRQTFSIIIEGFGMRIKGFHILTTSPAADIVVSFIKPLISPKLGKRISTHKDINSLCQYVPLEILPLEYGGKERSFIELHDKLKHEVFGKVFMTYLEEMNEAKTDETVRQTDAFNEHYMGAPGSFRILNVD